MVSCRVKLSETCEHDDSKSLKLDTKEIIEDNVRLWKLKNVSTKLLIQNLHQVVSTVQRFSWTFPEIKMVLVTTLSCVRKCHKMSEKIKIKHTGKYFQIKAHFNYL